MTTETQQDLIDVLTAERDKLKKGYDLAMRMLDLSEDGNDKSREFQRKLMQDNATLRDRVEQLSSSLRVANDLCDDRLERIKELAATAIDQTKPAPPPSSNADSERMYPEGQYVEAMQALGRMESERNTYRDGLNAANSTISRLTKERDKAQDEVKAFAQAIKSANAEVTRLTTELVTEREAANTEAENVGNLRREVEALDRKNRSLQEEKDRTVSVQTDCNEGLLRVISSKEDTICRLNITIRTISRENSELQGELRGAKERLKVANDKLIAIRVQVNN